MESEKWRDVKTRSCNDRKTKRQKKKTAVNKQSNYLQRQNENGYLSTKNGNVKS